MKVNGYNRMSGISNYQQMNQKCRVSKNEGLKKDQISISEEAKALLEQTTAKDSNGPTAKVREIKEQIENGTYQVDSGLVADKMLDWSKK
ncbi:flagellar biosynthesis anti-sigma factor FlgM [Vulcanibacillus modesticaldus]|uniref:Negative regulator of flagellin synthesis n=1 Tax=Vulcanibacillus modesticaldus TaxID=337097 RepID=A0A1D2YV02_9BACI|nr:flagellar biosynthesis anti-sigma factor FlgM [Vulcanibacillus modesticaldus]OEF99503.1 flagellar biosynthesis anti-sigma factor FlgM [Vulcanibacillus modesticaldus]